MTRFILEKEAVIDSKTGLMWVQNASFFSFPMTWKEAFSSVKSLNESGFCGYHDWKIPNRKELFSLICHDRVNPAIPEDHPFEEIFNSYYWTSSTCKRLPDLAWYIHMGGARVSKGMKSNSCMVWPVRISGQNKESRLFESGQRNCFSELGHVIDCSGTGQDGEFQAGIKHAPDRFAEENGMVFDKSYGLFWLKNANICKFPISWNSAFEFISELNSKKFKGFNDWRVPSVAELESLTDLEMHSPALPLRHLFHDVQKYYWSSTESMYNTSYSWVLYMEDGAVGVGFKKLSDFYLWPVRG
jgi:hypothetical protein